MSVYIDISYIETQMPAELLNLLTNDDMDTYDTDTINNIIEEVENEIDSYILASDYVLTEVQADPPATLRRIALKLVKFYVYSRKAAPDEEVFDENQALYIDMNDARRQLEEIRDGRLLLTGLTKSKEKLQKTMKGLVQSDTALFNTTNFKDYWTTGDVDGNNS